MEESMREFLNEKRIGVIALEMPDGSPHGATVHFAHQEDPLLFVFLTDRSYRKAEALLAKESVRASLVIGTDESEMKTLQLDGTASLTDEQTDKDIYFGKFAEKAGKPRGPEAIFFTFTPTWWRYTDWKRPEGKTLLYSDGRIEVAN